MRLLARRAVDDWVGAHAHTIHHVSLAVIFIWLGSLKQFGHETTTSLLAHTIYWGDPATMVRVLGAWEIVIGCALLVPMLHRTAVILIIVRLPGTLLALILMPDVTFIAVPFVPSPEGQYLLKDLALFGAALVIAEAGMRRERHTEVTGRP
jgi:uncharacterized membrane protein YkgB